MTPADLDDAATLKLRLRQRLADSDTRAVTPLVGGDDRYAERAVRVPVHAAVLLGVIDRAPEPRILLTQRSASLKDHAGQISFPGGRLEAGELPLAAALREASEETGLDPHAVDVLGELPAYRTITGFHVHPFVAWVDGARRFTPDPIEVAEIFEVPISFVLDERNHRRDSYERNGERRHFYVLPFDDRYIWGATAGMLVNFARLVNRRDP